MANNILLSFALYWVWGFYLWVAVTLLVLDRRHKRMSADVGDSVPVGLMSAGGSASPTYRTGRLTMTRCIRVTLWVGGKTAALGVEFGEINSRKPKSIIHLINNNIKLFYSYYANYYNSKIWPKNHPIVVN